jgi:hypothetical protein
VTTARVTDSPIRRIAGKDVRLAHSAHFVEPERNHLGLGEPRQTAQTGRRGFADRRSSSSDAAVKLRRLSVYLEAQDPARLLAGVLEAAERAAEAQP